MVYVFFFTRILSNHFYFEVFSGHLGMCRDGEWTGSTYLSTSLGRNLAVLRDLCCFKFVQMSSSPEALNFIVPLSFEYCFASRSATVFMSSECEGGIP